MELVVIGAGPAYTDRWGAAGASYLVRADEAARGASAGAARGASTGAARGASTGAARGASAGAALLLDLGQGAFPNLASTLEPSLLTAVVVSHLHPDHFIDLVPLRHYLRYEFDPPRRVRVVGPAGMADRLDALHGHPDFAAISLDVAPLEPGLQRIGLFTVEARRVAHTDESYALRVSVADCVAAGHAAAGHAAAGHAAAGHAAAGAATGVAPGSAPALVYSGDCGRADDLVPLIRPGDTLLCEASFGAGTVPHGAEHLTAVDAARAATAGHAARLLLTHIQMGFDRGEALAAAQSVFAGSVQLVTEGDRFEV